MSVSPALAAYARWYETVSPERVEDARALLAPDIRFKDPWNDVRGVEAFLRIHARMFAQVRNPRFLVIHIVQEGAIGYLRWRFTFSAKRGNRHFTVEGMTEVHLAADGRIAQHIDHFDVAGQIYEGVPVLGAVLRAIRRRVADRG
jgi:hypothetical protein